jgi:hypothetical protein
LFSLAFSALGKAKPDNLSESVQHALFLNLPAPLEILILTIFSLSPQNLLNLAKCLLTPYHVALKKPSSTVLIRQSF